MSASSARIQKQMGAGMPTGAGGTRMVCDLVLAGTLYRRCGSARRCGMTGWRGPDGLCTTIAADYSCLISYTSRQCSAAWSATELFHTGVHACHGGCSLWEPAEAASIGKLPEAAYLQVTSGSLPYPLFLPLESCAAPSGLESRSTALGNADNEENTHTSN